VDGGIQLMTFTLCALLISYATKQEALLEHY